MKQFSYNKFNLIMSSPKWRPLFYWLQSTVTSDQSSTLLTIWPLAVSYVETRSYPSRISKCWSNILRSHGNGAISQEIRDDSSSIQVNFCMIHNLSDTHLFLWGFCFESIIKRCLMMVILFCRPQPSEVVVFSAVIGGKTFKCDGKYEVMDH